MVSLRKQAGVMIEETLSVGSASSVNASVKVDPQGEGELVPC
jgi:hypothetical protein